jgi:hypothetical protein
LKPPKLALKRQKNKKDTPAHAGIEALDKVNGKIMKLPTRSQTILSP